MDTADEGLETFTLSLTLNPPGSASFIGGSNQAMVTILNDDGKYHIS